VSTARDLTIAQLRREIADLRADLEDERDENARLQVEIEELSPPKEKRARYEVHVVVGDGSIRPLLSEECTLETAEREVRELSATGYKARVVPA